MIPQLLHPGGNPLKEGMNYAPADDETPDLKEPHSLNSALFVCVLSFMKKRYKSKQEARE